MSSAKTAIMMSMKSSLDWQEQLRGMDLFRILSDAQCFFVPEKIDRREPERFKFDPLNSDRFLDLWSRGWVNIRWSKPYSAWMIVQIHSGERFNELIAGFDERYFQTPDERQKILSFAKAIYLWGSMAHGYICHEQEWNLKNYLGRPTRVRNRVTSTGGLWLEDCLPGAYWANFFGNCYTEFFGVEKLIACPSYVRERFPDGGFMILSSESPAMYRDKQVAELEQNIVHHLGPSAFFDRSHPQKTTQAPQFEFKLSSRDMTVFDPVSEAIPDPESFIRDVVQISGQLQARFVGLDLDYSAKSLEKIDELVLNWPQKEREPWKDKDAMQLLREVSAYYGEVFRRQFVGIWSVRAGFGVPNLKSIHPVIVQSDNEKNVLEYPFSSVFRLWSGKGDAPRLADAVRVSRKESFVARVLKKWVGLWYR